MTPDAPLDDPTPAPARLAPDERPRAPLAPGLRLARMLWRVVPPAGFVVLAEAAAALLDAPDAVRRQVHVGAGFVGAWAVLRAIVLEVLSPVRPALRMVPLSDLRAVQVAAWLKVVLAFLLATELSTWLLEANGAEPGLVMAVRIVRDAGLLLFATVAILALGVLQGLRDRAGGGSFGAVATVATRVLFPLAVPAALVVLVAGRLGFRPFADWITSRVFATAGQALLAVLLWRLLKGSLRNLITYGRKTGPDGTPAEPSPTLVGFERLMITLLRATVILATALWGLSTWGLTPSRLREVFAEPVVSGGAHTWGALVLGFAKVFAVLLAWRVLETVLTFFVFPGAGLDVGARFAILAVLRYVLVALAAFFVLGALGLELGSFAWFFGAAGIGLGLGLQDVIANFFGGLLMLVERPVRVGDLIEVGNATGTVEDIRIRGTVIRTASNTTVLVPNRQMMSERLTNLSYGIGTGLVEVRLTVPYDVDTTRLEQALLRIAQRHPDVVADPAPSIRMEGFGELGIDLSLQCHTSRVRARGAVASDLRHAILDEMRRMGIELPTRPVRKGGAAI
jgi:potassium-dependent mechanosensitive channel